MAAADFLNGTLVLVDPSILSCWEEKVKQGLDCSLMLKHSKGVVNTIFKWLMIQHAAAMQSLPQQEFQCDQCDFTSTSKRVLSNHKSHKHKNSEKPEILRDLELNRSLNFSHASEEREELSSVNADMEEPDVEEIEKMREVLEETNKCLFCGFKAAVPWVHPSKGTNLSGMDIWDHVWANHPTETEWFA